MLRCLKLIIRKFSSIRWILSSEFYQVRTKDCILLRKVEICSSPRNGIWSSVSYSYKLLMLIYGAYLSWDCRKSLRSTGNDVKHISIIIYTTIILGVICLPMVLLYKDKVDFAYGVATISIICGSTVMLAASFIPKVKSYIVFIAITVICTLPI